MNNVLCMDNVSLTQVLFHKIREKAISGVFHSKFSTGSPGRLNTYGVPQILCQLDPKSPTLEDQALLMHQTKAEPICHCELSHKQY